MKCVIIDDELSSREILTVLITKQPNLQLVKKFSNAIDAINFLNDGNIIDLIFLDLHMPHFSGFDFIETIKNPPKIIMTTTDREAAVNAFNFDCIIDFLHKPFESARFEIAVQRANKKIMMVRKSEKKTESEKPQEIFLNVDKRLVKIDFSNIKYIKSNGDYFNIYTETTSFTVHSTLNKIEAKLSNLNFLRIHRSYIINLNKIIDIQDASVLIGDIIIPISRLKRQMLIDSLFLINKFNCC